MMPKIKHYKCSKCKEDWLYEDEVERRMEMTFSGHIVYINFHTKCGEPVEETKLFERL